MRTSTQILPGVKSIGWIDCQQLQPRVDLAGICGMPVTIFTDIHQIQFFDEPTCECKSKKEAGGFEDTVTLKFLAAEKLPEGATAFIVTDVNGCSYLIGSLEKPHAQVQSDRSTGTPSGSPAGFQYEITHVAIKSMVPCIISTA